MRLAAPMLILGSFAFGYNAATALHELGHAVAIWSVGGDVKRMTIHPFSWSYTSYESSPPHGYVDYCDWAGAVFGLLTALALTLIGRLIRSPFAAPLLMTGLAACFYNGLYFIVDALAGTGGDAQDLHERGTPRWILVGFGVAAVVLGMFVASRVLPSLGSRPTDRIRDRVLTFELGFGPYLLAMWLYHVIMGRQVVLWSIYAGAGLVLVALVGAASVLLVRRSTSPDTKPITLVPTAFSLALGVGVVVFELLFMT